MISLRKETGKKISQSHKGKYLSKEHKLAISKGLKGKCKGIPKSENAKLAMRKPKSSTVNMKKPKTEEHKKKLSEASKKLWQNPEYRKKACLSMKGKIPWNKKKDTINAI